MAGPRGLTRLVGRVQSTLHRWTPPRTSVAKEVLEAFMLTTNSILACWLQQKRENYFAPGILEGLAAVGTGLLARSSGLAAPSTDRMNIDASTMLMEYRSRSTLAGSPLG